MSAGYDPPTRRIEAQPPAAGPPPVEPVEHELLRRIRSLQTMVALVGLLAVAALGVALYTLLTDEDRDAGDGRRGASTSQVERLSDDVAELENRIDDRATKSSVSELEGQVEELAEQAEQAGEEGGDVERLRSDVEELQQRVDDLARQQQQQQEQQPDTGGAETP